MKTSQLTELKIFTEKLIQKCNCGLPEDRRGPDGKKLNPATQKKILLVQSEQVRALKVVLDKIKQIESR